MGIEHDVDADEFWLPAQRDLRQVGHQPTGIVALADRPFAVFVRPRAVAVQAQTVKILDDAARVLAKQNGQVVRTRRRALIRKLQTGVDEQVCLEGVFEARNRVLRSC